MIYDHISNIATYRDLSTNIALGLDFLKQMNPYTAVGTYQINQQVNAIVSEYETKTENEHGYEAHRKYIDIQYLLNGTERIACLPFERLKETQSYNYENDAAFYAADRSLLPTNLSLLPGYFAILFPQDGHMPQLCVDKPIKVKKVVIKVEIE